MPANAGGPAANPAIDRLAAAAQQRHEATLARAQAALRAAEQSGEPVTYAKIASAAQVSRAWLYTQPDIRTALDRLRAVNGRSAGPDVPTEQRATAASLVRRLEAVNRRNRELTRQVAELRNQLASAHGALRDVRAGRTTGDGGTVTAFSTAGSVRQ